MQKPDIQTGRNLRYTDIYRKRKSVNRKRIHPEPCKRRAKRYERTRQEPLDNQAEETAQKQKEQGEEQREKNPPHEQNHESLGKIGLIF